MVSFDGQHQIVTAKVEAIQNQTFKQPSVTLAATICAQLRLKFGLPLHK